MKKYLFYFLSFIAVGFSSCSDNDDGSVDFINNLNAPQNVNAVFEITQDNTGLVTLTPVGEGANSFVLDFGDGSKAQTVLPGKNVKHTYTEGNFNVGITAVNLAGERTTVQKDLTVSFKAPENLEVTIEPVPTDPFSIRVSATADFETFFQVFFGDVENENPTPFNQGDVITHTYDDVGEYVVRVIALSGGDASSEFTQTVTITNPLLLPVNFESDKLDFTFIDFEGATATVIDNPDATGINTSTKVAQFIKGDGAQFFAGSILELDDIIDFSTLRKIKMNVWSPKSGIVVKLKLENATDPNISAEVDVVNTVANQWEELIFDFTGMVDGKELSKLIFFFDFENGGDGASYFFDDIEQTNDSVLPVALPLNFETSNQVFTTFNGATFNLAPDPENPNNQTGQLINSGAQFEGISLDLDEAVDFSTEKLITLRFFTSTPNNAILLKFENGTADAVEVIENVTTSGWSTVTFDFSQAQLSFPLSGPINASGSFSTITLFVDGPDTTPGTYFFDDITAGDGGPATPINLPLTFEDTQTTFEWIGFGAVDFGPIPAAVINNPDPSGINTSSRVLEITKAAGAQVWAGASLNLSGAMDFSAGTTASVKVWSPRAGTPILFKIEDSNSPLDGNGNPTVFVEIQASTSVANAWEELTFDLTSVTSFSTAIPYDRVILFPDFGNAGTGDTFFFDDVRLTTPGQGGGGGNIMLPLGFEDTQTTFDWIGFGAADFGPIPALVTSNPQPSGINTSARVLEINKTSGAQVWAGASLNLSGAIDFSAGTTASVKVWSPRAGTPILFKIENSNSPLDGNGNPTVFVEIQASTSVANAWEELTFDLTSASSFSTAIPYDRVILFPDFGNPGSGDSFFFDDIRLTTPGQGGGGGGTGSAPFNPIDFEQNGFGANWTWTVFENASNPPVEIVANPNPSGINTSSTVLKATALQAGMPWMGFESQHGTDIGSFTFDQTNSIVKMMVWKSVISDIGLKFAEASGEAQPEIKVANTKINEWEEITFDVSSLIGKGITGVIDQIIIFPDFNLNGRTSDNVIYIDNITFNAQSGGGTGGGGTGGGGTGSAPSLIEDFQGAAPEFTSFGNIPTSAVVSNPNPSGINTSSLVAELNKVQGSEVWAGSFIENKIIDVASMPYIKVKVLSPKSGITIKAKIENQDASVTHEVDVTNTTANAWEELSYNFSGAPAGNFVRFVIFFDFGTPGDGSVYHFDDIILSTTSGGTSGGGGTGGGTGGGSGSAGTPPLNPIDFEANGFGADWTWTVFENGSNPPVEIVANPDPSGINTSGTVLKATALQAGMPWMGFESQHGSDIGSFTFDQTNKIVRIMVWKSVISDVGLKFAENNGEAQPEIKIPNTKVNEWEEITFDVSSLIGKGITGIIDQIIIFPDFDLSGRTQDNVIYIDNIRFSGQ